MIKKSRFAHFKLLSLGLAVIVALSISSWADEEWLDVKDAQGRKLTVKIQKVENKKVTFSTKNGKTYTYPITKFAVTDQLMLRKWKPAAGSDSPVKEDSKLEQIKSSDTQTLFRTKHFEFDVVGEASADQLGEIAPFFEAVHWAFSQLPVEVTPKAADSHFQVKIYLTESDFGISSQEELGAEQPAVFNLGKNLLLAPLQRLNPSPALTREVAYTLLGKQLETMPPWLAVALTEYLAAAPYGKLALDMKDPLKNMTGYLDQAYGLSGKTLGSLRPEAVTALDYRTLRADGLDGNKGRSSALINFYYFAHLDRKGKGMADYMRAVKTSAAPDEAFAALANERDAQQLEDEFKVAFVSKKLRIAFIQ